MFVLTAATIIQFRGILVTRKELKALKEKESSPIINFHTQMAADYLEQYLTLCEITHKRKDTLIKEVQERLGQQTYCITFSRRYWVWQTDTYRLYVHNEQGLSVEVMLNTRNMHVKPPMECWQDLVNDMCRPTERKRVKEANGKLARAMRNAEKKTSPAQTSSP